MKDALHQMAQLGHFVHCCHTGDAMEAAFALQDVLAEPHRIPLQPHFNEVQAAAMNAGARAGGISGSGPSSYWISFDNDTAKAIGQAISTVFLQEGMDHHVHVGKIAAQGARIIEA
jgi:homoserine kinase